MYQKYTAAAATASAITSNAFTFSSMAAPVTDRVLCIVAHPDDETLGCGATIAKHARAGDAVSIVTLADGLASRGAVTSEAIKARHGMLRRACKILGTEDVWIHQYADNQMDTLALLQVAQHIETHIARFKPTVVYTHWKGDLNVDHRVTHDAVNIACRPQPGCAIRRLFYFEVPCSTSWGGGFKPNYYVDVADTFTAKLEAMACYETELRGDPHPRSYGGIQQLSWWRGSQVGIAAAEAFMAARIVA